MTPFLPAGRSACRGSFQAQVRGARKGFKAAIFSSNIKAQLYFQKARASCAGAENIAQRGVNIKTQQHFDTRRMLLKP